MLKTSLLKLMIFSVVAFLATRFLPDGKPEGTLDFASQSPPPETIKNPLEPDCDKVEQNKDAVQVCTFAFQSEALGEEAFVRILLPPKFSKTQTYPSLYFLHGRESGMQKDRLSMVETVGDADELKTRPWIVIAPQDLRGNDYWMNGARHHRKWNDFLSKDLIEAVEDRFPVRKRACSRLISGISMGAYGAFLQAFLHPDLYAGFAAHSPVFRFDVKEIRLNPNDPKAFGESPLELKERLLTWKYEVDRLSYGKPMWIDIGSQDELAVRVYKRTFEFIRSLKDKEPQAQITIYEGTDETHTFEYWKKHRPEAYRWYAEQLAKNCR